MTPLPNNHIAVAVPEGAYDIAISNSVIGWKSQLGVSWEPLPPGQWSIVGKGDELSEEQWKTILPQVRGGFAGHLAGYKDYNDNGLSMDKAPLKTATESGLSLFTSLGLKPKENLILKLII